VRHTKSLTVDGAMSVFGSVNLDMRSLWLNFEISAFVYDDAFTGRLRALQDRYLAVSRLLDRGEWNRQPALHHLPRTPAGCSGRCCDLSGRSAAVAREDGGERSGLGVGRRRAAPAVDAGLP
jgi:hypothetical protein